MAICYQPKQKNKYFRMYTMRFVIRLAITDIYHVRRMNPPGYSYLFCSCLFVSSQLYSELSITT